MATVFDAHFAATGFPMLLDNFGEPITYYPKSGGYRTITAIVEREPPAILDVSGNAVQPKLTIRIYNSATSGISSKEVDIGSDQIALPEHVGDIITRKFSLMQLVSQDSGVTQLALM